MRRWLVPAVLVAAGATLCLRITASAERHDDVFTGEGLLVAKAETLKATLVTPHLEVPIQPGRNVLWCGTFQLVWNEIGTLVGGDIHFDQDTPEVEALNRKAFARGDLDEASHVSLAGFVGEGIFDRIPRALRAKFGGKASPHYLPAPHVGMRPQDIVGYSYLFKHLEFAMPFERLDQPLDFAGTPLPAFGLGPYKSAQSRMLPQVRLFAYEGPDDFVIELRSKAKEDQLILAKVSSAATLGETVEAVVRRTAAAPEEAVPGDILAVPLANFDITREYGELYGRRLVAKNPQVARDLVVLSALQNIRFQMDEKGVRLRSESPMSFGCASVVGPRPTHVMIFDKPFLLLMKRTAARTPYFALWVDNPELLVETR